MTASDLQNRDNAFAPRPLRFAALALVLSALAMVAFARLTDAPLAAAPDLTAPIAEERSIVLEGDVNGGVTVLDHRGDVIVRLDPSEGGFVAGVERALSRVRTQHGVPEGMPVRLIRYESGRLALADPYTSWHAELQGFGRDNIAAFARLLHQGN